MLQVSRLLVLKFCALVQYLPTVVSVVVVAVVVLLVAT